MSPVHTVFASLLSELRAINQSIHDQISSIRDAYEADRQTRDQIPANIEKLAVIDNEKRENRSYKNKSYNVQVVLAIGTCGAFIAAAIYADLAYKQLREMHNATVATQQAAYDACLGSQISRVALLEAIQAGIDAHDTATASAYQTILAGQSEAADIVINPNQLVIDWGKTLQVPVTIMNTGKSVATNVHTEIRLMPVKRTEDPIPTYPKKQSGFLETPELIAGGMIASLKNGAIPARDPEGKMITVTKSFYDETSSGIQDFLLFAHITYRDIFGVQHWIDYCRTFPNADSGSMSTPVHAHCIRYNERDHNTIVRKPTKQPVAPQVPEIVCNKPKE